MANYWTATDDILGSAGAPLCLYCGKPMFPADDHGRFTCFCQGIGKGIRNNTFDAVSGTMLPAPPRIPQVDTTGMTDEQKAKIPPINRLNGQATTAESKLLDLMLKGTNGMNSPEYAAAMQAVAEERE